MSERRPPKLVSTALSHANRVHALLEQRNRGDDAARLAAEAQRWVSDATTVVVAGDIKRGKSSLINALLDRPGLLPVDSDVATAVHLVVSHGDQDRAVVRFLDDETREIPLEEIAAYASMSGADETVDRVGGVEVTIDHPLLARGLHIIDTPGVGGMSRGHRDITMAALSRADVFLFVVSLQEPVARTELEFLAEACERIGTVVLVGSRADLGTDEANASMAADLRRRIELLAAERPDGAGLARLARRPLVCTSAHLADQARRRAERGRHEQAAAIRAQSGLDELIAHMERSVEAREHLRLTNLLQLVSTLLISMDADEAARARAVDGDSTVQADLEQRQAELERAASNQARWRSTLATGMSRLQTSAGRDVSRELNVVRDHYRAVLEDQHDAVELEAISAEVQQSLHAAWANLSDQVTAQFATVIEELLADLEIAGDAEADLFEDLELPPSIRAISVRKRDNAGALDLVQDVLPMATQTFLFGNIANALVGVMGVATGGLGAMAFVVGAAVAAPIVATRRKQRARQQTLSELQRELAEALFGQEGVSREFTTELSLRILDAREKLETLIDERLVARRRMLEQQRQELIQLLKAEQGERVAAQREAERVAAEIRALRDETERLGTQVESELTHLFTAAPVAAEPTAPIPSTS